MLKFDSMPLKAPIGQKYLQKNLKLNPETMITLTVKNQPKIVACVENRSIYGSKIRVFVELKIKPIARAENKIIYLNLEHGNIHVQNLHLCIFKINQVGTGIIFQQSLN